MKNKRIFLTLFLAATSLIGGTEPIASVPCNKNETGVQCQKRLGNDYEVIYNPTTKTLRAELKSLKGVVNVNTATESQLMLLPHIGAHRASDIVEWIGGVTDGVKHPIKQLSDMSLIRCKTHKLLGLSGKTLNDISPYITYSGETTLNSKVKLNKM